MAESGWPKLTRLQLVPRSEGLIGIAEASKQVGFTIRRMFFIKDGRADDRRKGHAHIALRQCVACVRGAVTIDAEQNGERRATRLSDHGTAMILEPGRWHEFYDFSDDALLVVLASDEYDEADYIRDYDDFRAWEKARQADPVPYVAFDRQARALDVELDRAITGVLRSGIHIGGPELDAFEREFAGYCGALHATGVANGLQALSLALRAREIGPGDEVIVPVNSAIATALAVTEVGATPVLVDVEEDTGLIDTRAAAAAVTTRTRALIPVHLYGHPADMEPLRALAREYRLFLLEDSAQAHGARYLGARCGSLGDAAGFSFYPTKNLGGVGDGGAVVSSDKSLTDAVRRLGNYGSRTRYVHTALGTNSRLDTLQAAILRVKLPHLEAWTETRRRHAAHYMDGLDGLDGIFLPGVRPWAQPVWHIFPLRVADGRRDALAAALDRAGIATNIHYPVPIHLQAAYSGLGLKPGAFPVAERRASELLSLPIDPFHRDAEIDRVIDAVRAFERSGAVRSGDGQGLARRARRGLAAE